MTGRQEEDLKIENKIKNKIAHQPKIIKKYYNFISGKTPKTKLSYINNIIRYAEWISDKGYSIENQKYLLNVKKSDINEYVEELRYHKNSDGTIKENSCSNILQNLYSIRDFYDFLVDDGIIVNNVFNGYKMPKERKEIAITSMNKKEVDLVRKKISNGSVARGDHKTRDLAIFTLGIRTGLRISALININVSDIDMENKTIRVTEKGNVTKYVYFGDDTANVLQAWLKERKDIPGCDALFTTRENRRITYNGVHYLLKQYTENLDKHITPHKMRSTYGTNLYQQTHDIYLVADGLGHKNIANTRRYADVSNENRVNAANIMDKY